MNNSNLPTHIAFSDESHWNEKRYRSIAAITMNKDHLGELEDHLLGIYRESGISEFRWKDIKGARERFVALKICDFVIKNTLTNILRVDVVCWDVYDSRHNIPQRDDVKNLHRMYRFLFQNILSARWPKGASWELCPHEHTAVDWNHIKTLLDWDKEELKIYKDLFTQNKHLFSLKEKFNIDNVHPNKSSDKLFIQLADLFAGMCCFSRIHFKEYILCENRMSKQLEFELFDNKEKNIKLSRPIKEKSLILHHFYKKCKSKKFGVSLRIYKGLKTFNPQNPINFWWYEPQHKEDKAPTK